MRLNVIVKGTALAMIVASALVLSACSKSRETRAAEACVAEFVAKIEKDRPYRADIAAIAAMAKAEGADLLVIESEATLDAAQANESKQKFLCRVQFDASKPDADPAVILFQFAF